MSKSSKPELKLPASAEPEEVVKLITRALESLVDDERYREGVTRVIPGAGMVYGVRVPDLRELARQIIKTYPSQSDIVIEIAEACWRVGSREHSVLAILILAGMKVLTPEERWELGLRFLPDVGDWETCDQLCMGLLGQALTNKPTYMDSLESWVQDPNFWVRRAALASTVVLRRAKFDAETLQSLNQRTLGLCFDLLDDKQHYVRKAVDWAVRELIRRDYDLGCRWLMARATDELTSVARSTLKKSAKKLSSEDQARFLHKLDQ